MKQLIAFLFVLATLSTEGQQKRKTENVFIVTLDGYRWKELFTGADQQLMVQKKYVLRDSAALAARFWANTPEERRQKLMPFFWNTIARQGQLYGNRTLGNFMNVKNPYWFSYPGYNEIFTGFPDTLINSNDFPPNPNENVLEFINKKPGYKNKVGVFASWDAYYRILNEDRSGLYINAGWSDFKGPHLNETQKLLNHQQAYLPRIFGPAERLDAPTFEMAMEYLKQNHPKVFYLAFIETDGFAHQGKYNLYLNAAHNIDAMIGELWSFIQQDPLYKDHTTIIITADHGRGDDIDWVRHGRKVIHADEIWLAVMGPDTKPLGEVKQNGQLFQNQIAKTIAGLLGLGFTGKNIPGEPIKSVFGE